jgi:hypothetical protein
MGGPPKVDWAEYEKEKPVTESTVPDPTDKKEGTEVPKTENK